MSWKESDGLPEFGNWSMVFCVIAIVYDECSVGGHRGRVADGMYPHIGKNINFRAFSHTDKLMDSGNREKEKACVFFARAVIFQKCIIFWPVRDFAVDSGWK